MQTTWKDIIGYEGLYQVSNLGQVRSISRTVYEHNGKRKSLKGQVLKLSPTTNGYLNVALSINSIRKSIMVHRLVAIHFIPNPNNHSDVNHKDECKTNNHADNLEWCSHRYNVNYGTMLKRRTATVKKSGIFKGSNNYSYGRKGGLSAVAKPVLQVSSTGEIINEFSSVIEAATQFNLNPSLITGVCRGRKKTCGSYYWRYKHSQQNSNS